MHALKHWYSDLWLRTIKYKLINASMSCADGRSFGLCCSSISIRSKISQLVVCAFVMDTQIDAFMALARNTRLVYVRRIPVALHALNVAPGSISINGNRVLTVVRGAKVRVYSANVLSDFLLPERARHTNAPHTAASMRL